jgi:uncharacterized protein (TIGR00251 family)
MSPTPREEPRWFRWIGDDLELSLRVQPRASREGFDEPVGDHCRIRVKAPPVEGQANAALCRFLARSFGVPKGAVELVSGEQSRNKRVMIRSPRRLPEPIAGP